MDGVRSRTGVFERNFSGWTFHIGCHSLISSKLIGVETVSGILLPTSIILKILKAPTVMWSTLFSVGQSGIVGFIVCDQGRSQRPACGQCSIEEDMGQPNYGCPMNLGVGFRLHTFYRYLDL